MANKTSQHILNTSANLLGFCLFVITALQLSNKRELTFIDEFTAIISLILVISSLLSFLSIRTYHAHLEQKYEATADTLFMIALSGIMCVISFIVLNIMK